MHDDFAQYFLRKLTSPPEPAASAPYARGMTSSPRRGPAIAMTASVVGAIALAALFPVYATGDWAKTTDPWEATRATIADSGLENAPDERVDPATITMLDPTQDGGFAFAALTVAGAPIAGVGTELGYTSCTGLENGPTAEINCSFWGAPDELEYTIWVQKSESAPGGFRHTLTSKPHVEPAEDAAELEDSEVLE